MAKPRRILTDAELIDYSGYHLLYEVQMLFFTAVLLTRAFGRITLAGEEEQLVRYALLESFSLHLRNLIRAKQAARQTPTATIQSLVTVPKPSFVPREGPLF